GRIEINLAIVRTVERPHGGLCEPAARSCYAGKHNESRRLVGLAGLRKDLLPLRFGAAEHGGYELRHLVRGGARASLLRLLLLLLRAASARQNVGSADQNAWIYAEPPAEETKYDDGADPHPSPPTGNAKAAAVLAAAVFDVVTTRQLIETHCPLSSGSLPFYHVQGLRTNGGRPCPIVASIPLGRRRRVVTRPRAPLSGLLGSHHGFHQPGDDGEDRTAGAAAANLT